MKNTEVICVQILTEGFPYCPKKMAMNPSVEVSFTCIPLRSLGRFDPPLDATEEQRSLWTRLHLALNAHGAHNAFYLHDATCVFHLTNDETVGMVAFRFEGTVLTDSEDRKTVGVDLQVEYDADSCEWLTAAACQWLRETVERAVRVEFDRYIAVGDLQRTIERMQQIEAETKAGGGYLGMGI